MKRLSAIMLVLLVAFVAFQGVAEAKLVSGKVAAVDTEASTLSVKVMDPATGAESEVTIAVNESTAYKGVAAIGDLQPGAEVWINAEGDDAAGWTATSVEVPVA
jgi:hypothetical protein